MSVSWVGVQQSNLCFLSLYVAHTAQLEDCDQTRGRRIALDFKSMHRTKQYDKHKCLWPHTSLMGTFERATQSNSLQDKWAVQCEGKGESWGWGNVHAWSLGIVSAVCTCYSYGKTLAFCQYSHLALRTSGSLWAPTSWDSSIWAYRLLVESPGTIR